MTFAELMGFLHTHLNYPWLTEHGDVTATWEAARAGTLSDPVVAEAMTLIYQGNGCTGIDSALERATTITALAPLRLKSQADDASPELFRKVLKLSQETDNAFDQELIGRRDED